MKSIYPVLIQNFIIWDNFLNILSFPTNRNQTILTAYGPDLIKKQQELQMIMSDQTVFSNLVATWGCEQSVHSHQ